MFATFTFDASAIANLGTVIAQMESLGFTLAHIDASAPASAPAPVSVSVASAPAPEVAPTREYKACEDTLVRLDVDGKYVVYTTADGKYLGTSGIRKACNARLRKVATYDSARKAWAFKSAKAAMAWCETETVAANDVHDEGVTAMLTSTEPITHWVMLITASEWQAQRDRAAARKSKKA